MSLSLFQNFPTSTLQRFHTACAFGFQITPDHRFGAAGSEGNPFTVGQEEFVAVGGDEFLHGRGADLVQTLRESIQNGGFLRGIDVDVDTVGVEFADVFFQLLENFAEWFTFYCHEFGHEQAGEDAVLFGHVPFDAEAAAFLAANDYSATNAFKKGSDTDTPNLDAAYDEVLNARKELKAIVLLVGG